MEFFTIYTFNSNVNLDYITSVRNKLRTFYVRFVINFVDNLHFLIYTHTHTFIRFNISKKILIARKY